MGVALEKDNSKDFFYSDSLGKFVAYDFLKIDVRVVDAASKLGIHLDWDEEGHVCNINFTEARRLLDGLGSHLLTPKEYWQVRNEADKNGEVRAVRSLELDIGTEWLDAVFIKKAPTGPVLLIEHPLVLANGINQESSTILTQPDARPGWFNPVNNINADTGMPISISLTREKGTPAWSQTTWKYWSTFQTNKLVAGIRGYVTSSGTPSLDLDIPVEARQPVLFICECRDELQNPEIRPELIEEFIRLEEVYLPTLALFPGVKNSGKHQIFYEQNQKLLEFVNTSYKEVATSNEKSALHIKEHVHDMLGIVYLEALKRGDRVVVKDIKTLQEATFGLSPEAGKYSHLKEFLESRRNELTKAVSENKRIVFVMGHKNPDTDTAISALFESYLKSLTDRDTVYVPVIQANRLPDEIAHLLGEDLSRAYVCTSEKIYQNAENLGQIRWILVDHNKSEKQRFTISMVDHHILSDVAKNQEIPKTWEMVGSCSAQITLKLYGLGVTLDGQTARLLHGATLMDTENRGPKKMTSRDILIMDNLRSASGVRDENSFYQELMGYLLNTDDSERLFQRDYKEDWGVFGFAVAKVKNVFDEKGGTLKPKVLAGLIKEAELNNSAKHFCMTLVKVVDYKQDNQTVNREKIYLVFNDFAPVEFRQVMLEGIERIVDDPPLALVLETERLPAADHLLQMRPATVDLIGGKEIEDVSAEDRIDARVKAPGQGLVGGDDGSLAVQQEDRFETGVEKPPDRFLALAAGGGLRIDHSDLLRKALAHGLKRAGQLGDLIPVVDDIDRHIQVAAGHPVGGIGESGKRAGNDPGNPETENDGEDDGENECEEPGGIVGAMGVGVRLRDRPGCFVEILLLMPDELRDLGLDLLREPVIFADEAGIDLSPLPMLPKEFCRLADDGFPGL